MNKPIILGIAGGTASGKTTLATLIKEAFNSETIILSHDFYYKSLSNITKEERMQRNYDCPDAYETDLLISHIKSLLLGKTIERPVYSYTERLRQNDTVTVKTKPLIIVEGMLVFENDELANLMDIKIFVDTDADIRLTRLFGRDIQERGLDLNYIIQKYKSTLKPMHEKYVEPTKAKADIIIPGNYGINNTSCSIIIEKIRNML